MDKEYRNDREAALYGFGYASGSRSPLAQKVKARKAEAGTSFGMFVSFVGLVAVIGLEIIKIF